MGRAGDLISRRLQPVGQDKRGRGRGDVKTYAPDTLKVWLKRVGAEGRYRFRERRLHTETTRGARSLSGPTLIVPNIPSNVTLTSPFSLTGHLLFCPGDCGFQPPTFSVDVIGSGIATINLQFLFLRNGNPVLIFQSVTYDFQTPEPMSIVLLGSGLLGLAAKLRRHRWRR